LKDKIWIQYESNFKWYTIASIVNMSNRIGSRAKKIHRPLKKRAFELMHMKKMQVSESTLFLKGLFTNFEYITFFSCPTKGNNFCKRYISIKPLWLEIIEKRECTKSVRPSTIIYITIWVSEFVCSITRSKTLPNRLITTRFADLSRNLLC